MLDGLAARPDDSWIGRGLVPRSDPVNWSTDAHLEGTRGTGPFRATDLRLAVVVAR